MKIENTTLSASEFLLLIGLRPSDHIVIGKVYYRRATNRLKDADQFKGFVDTYFTPSSFFKKRRKKKNVQRCTTCFADLDFKDRDRSLKEAEIIRNILDQYGFYYVIVCSGRGLHIYVPVDMEDKRQWEFFNRLLNKIILEQYYQQGIVDKKLITNYASFLRLPGTINSKNGKQVFVVCHNLDGTTNYFQHNYDLLLDGFIKNENAPASSDETESSSFANWDFDYGSFTSELLEKMLLLDLDIIETMKTQQDRHLNTHLFKNLAAYLYDKPERVGQALEFAKRIKGDVENLERWIAMVGTDTDEESIDEDSEDVDSEVFKLNVKELLNWAEGVFPNTKIAQLARSDYNRIYYNNGYYKFIARHLNYDSLEQLRADLDQSIAVNMDCPGIHWVIAETGVGKTSRFIDLVNKGKNVVFLVPYLMLLYNLNTRCTYTYDTIKESHRLRHQLMCDILDADLLVVDECHCMHTFQGISEDKRQILMMVDDMIRNLSKKIPVFLLTSTPSINQIEQVEHPEASKFIGFLGKDRKKVAIEIIDGHSLGQVIQQHDRVLIYVDDKNEVAKLHNCLLTCNVGHEVFNVTSKTLPDEKRQIEKKIRDIEKYIVIGTSSIASGINIPLETIVFSNRMMVQLNLYQVMGRLRIVNRLDEIHKIYMSLIL